MSHRDAGVEDLNSYWRPTVKKTVPVFSRGESCILPTRKTIDLFLRFSRMVLRRWFPEHPPTWTDVIIGLLILVWVPINVGYLQTIYWGWLLFGFVIGLVSIGPLANSPIGERVGRWFRNIGILGRAISITSFAVVVWIVRGQVNVPSEIVTSSVSGFMISILLYIFMFLLYSGEISGWER